MTRRNTWESITSPCTFVKLTISSKPNIQTSPLVTQHFARWNHRMPFFSKTHHLTNADVKNMKTFFSSSLHSRLIITIFGNNVYARGIQKILWLFVWKVHVCNAPKGKRYYLTTLIYPKPWNIKSGFLMMNKSDAASKDPPTTANLFTCYFYQVFPAPETSKGYRNQALSKSNQNLILYWFRLTLQRHTPVSTRIKYKAPSGIEVQ